MTKFVKMLKASFISLILLVFYIPIFYAFVFSFNSNAKKGRTSSVVFHPSIVGWKNLFAHQKIVGLANSLLISFVVGLIVISISLVTCFAIWKSKNLVVKSYISTTQQIPMINPDIITGITISLFLSAILGRLTANNEGFWRLVCGYVVMTLPYTILIMYPRSEKFSKNIFEASMDLGYNKFFSWWKTYFVFLLPSIFFSFLITLIFCFDDFIIARVTSNVTTFGTLLYQENNLKSWILAIGSLILMIILIVNICWSVKKIYLQKENWKTKKSDIFLVIFLILVVLMMLIFTIFMIFYGFQNDSAAQQISKESMSV